LFTGIGQGVTAVQNASLNSRIRQYQNHPFDEQGRNVI